MALSAAGWIGKVGSGHVSGGLLLGVRNDRNEVGQEKKMCERKKLGINFINGSFES